MGGVDFDGSRINTIPVEISATSSGNMLPHNVLPHARFRYGLSWPTCRKEIARKKRIEEIVPRDEDYERPSGSNDLHEFYFPIIMMIKMVLHEFARDLFVNHSLDRVMACQLCGRTLISISIDHVHTSASGAVPSIGDIRYVSICCGFNVHLMKHFGRMSEGNYNGSLFQTSYKRQPENVAID